MMTEKMPENAGKFVCNYCHFISSKQSNYLQHCSTRKHKMMTNDDNKNAIHEPTYICSHCDKSYKTKQSLWVHKQKCNPPQKENISMVIHDDDDIINTTTMQKYIMQLVEQNVELKNMFIKKEEDDNIKINELSQLITEQSKQIVIHNTTNNKTINNTQFNLNVFLQQTCKDAINMSDFIDSLEINTKSLERTGTHGYVHGISKIFMDGIRKLKIHERPIHCSDLKREVLYIKDNNKWEKDEENKQFKKALATVVHRNMIQIVKWEKENPETSNPESKNYDFYFEVVRQSLGGGDQDVTDRNNEKILKAIAQEVHIDKKSAMRTLQFRGDSPTI